MRISKTAVYFAHSESALQNGNYYRKNSEAATHAVRYINVNYMGKVLSKDIPADLKKFPRDKALLLIPR